MTTSTRSKAPVPSPLRCGDASAARRIGMRSGRSAHNARCPFQAASLACNLMLAPHVALAEDDRVTRHVMVKFSGPAISPNS
jgi:hypothetical protein